MNKRDMKKKIYEYDFAIHELVLFLDSHPTNRKALELIREYKQRRAKLVEEFEARFGAFVVNPSDAPATDCWEWIKSPWPWDNKFWED